MLFEAKVQQIDRWNDDHKTRVFRRGLLVSTLVGFLVGLALIPAEGFIAPFAMVGVAAVVWGLMFMWWSAITTPAAPDEPDDDG